MADGLEREEVDRDHEDTVGPWPWVMDLMRAGQLWERRWLWLKEMENPKIFRACRRVRQARKGGGWWCGVVW